MSSTNNPTQAKEELIWGVKFSDDFHILLASKPNNMKTTHFLQRCLDRNPSNTVLASEILFYLRHKQLEQMRELTETIMGKVYDS